MNNNQDITVEKKTNESTRFQNGQSSTEIMLKSLVKTTTTEQIYFMPVLQNTIVFVKTVEIKGTWCRSIYFHTRNVVSARVMLIKFVKIFNRTCKFV